MSTQKLTGELFYIIDSFKDFRFEDETVFADPEFARIVLAISRLTEELRAYDYEDFEELRASALKEMDVRLREALERTRYLSPTRSNEIMRRLQLLRSFVHDKAHLPSKIFDARRDFDEHYEEMLGYDDFIDKVLSPIHLAEDDLFENPDLWFHLARWGKVTSGISPRARQIVFWIAVRIRKGEEVSDRQQAAGVSILQEAEKKGFERTEQA